MGAYKEVNMYIIILDYEAGNITIRQKESSRKCKDYLEDNFNLNNCEYMIVDDFKLDIKIK